MPTKATVQDQDANIASHNTASFLLTTDTIHRPPQDKTDPRTLMYPDESENGKRRTDNDGSFPRIDRRNAL